MNPRGEVRRDRWGIPHVLAPTVQELAYRQGEVTAGDRSWQLDHARLKGLGATASLLGTRGLPWDRFARRMQLEALARRAYAALTPETLGFLEAYTAGVNAGLAAAPTSAEHIRLLVRPGRWEPWTPLAVFAAHHLLFGTFPAKLWRQHVHARFTDRLGAERGAQLAGLLHHEGREGAEGPGTAEHPLSAGSNSWVVGGGRTASGLPMIGGDPHRAFEAPNVYQQVRLTCTGPGGFDVAGFTFPGVPGVQHFAHAGLVAWAITNAMADYQDVFEERLERRGQQVRALTAHGWAPVAAHTETIEVRGEEPQDVQVVVTDNGPVFLGGPGERALSLRTASYAAGSLGFDCLLPLLRSRSVGDVEAALAGWVEPVNNLVVADVSGAVAQRVVGLVPHRPEAARWRPVPGADPAARWDGWVDPLPARTVGAEEHLVTANHRMGPEFDRVGSEFAPPGRARRLEALLEGRSALSAAEFAGMHRDVLAGQPAVLVEAVADLASRVCSGAGSAAGRAGRPSAAALALLDELTSWDQQLHADSLTAAAYVDVRDAFVLRLAATPPFDVLRLAWSDEAELFAPWFAVPTQLWLGLVTLLSARGRAILTAVSAGTDLELAPALDSALVAALEAVAAAPRISWGQRHRFAPAHALGDALVDPPPLAGDNDCVRCAGGLPGEPTAVRGSVARYVFDLGGLERSGWVVPLGASGDPRSPHVRDQLASWVAGELLPIHRNSSDGA